MSDVHIDDVPIAFALDRETIEAASPPPKRTRPLALLAQIWLHPRRAFEGVAAGSRWLWLIPFVCAVAALLFRAYIAAPLQVEQQTAQMQAQVALDTTAAQGQAFPAVEGDQTSSVVVPSTPLSVALAPALIGGLAIILLGWALRALILQVGSLAMGGRQNGSAAPTGSAAPSFGQVYCLSAWAAFPLILRDVVQGVYMLFSQALVTGPGLSGLIAQPDGVGTNVARNGLSGFGGAALSLPGVVLGKIDFFTLWFLVLLVLAMQVGGGLARGKAILLVAIYAILALLPGLLTALVGGALSGF